MQAIAATENSPLANDNSRSVRGMLPSAESGLGRSVQKERGEIAVGNVADLVVLDSQSIIDRATFADPTQLPEGIDLVIVDGTIAYRERWLTGNRAGRLLRRGSRG